MSRSDQAATSPPFWRRLSFIGGVEAAVSLVGLCDALYLTAAHLSGQSVRCTIVAGCNDVLGSAYASVGPMPVAGLGAAAYLVAFSLAILVAFGHGYAQSLLAILVTVMIVVTAWLSYVQAFVLGHFCQYCVLSALTTLLLGGLALAGSAIRRRRIGPPSHP